MTDGRFMRARRGTALPTKWRFSSAILAMTVVAATAAGCGTDSGGETASSNEPTALKLAHYLGTSNATGKGLEWFIEEVEASSDSIDIEPYWDGTLLAPDDTLQGIADGRTDIGFFASTYYPSQLPLTQFVSLPFVTDDVTSLAQAFNDVYETNDDLRAEYESQGVKVLTFVGIPPTIFAGREPLPDLAALRGKKIRATGYTADAFAAAGSDVLALAGTEIYESLERGLIDGYTSVNFATSSSLSLHEVAPHVYDARIGSYGFGVIAINLSTWESLSEDQQAAVTEAAEQWNTEYPKISAADDITACDAILAAGGTVDVWPDSEIEAWRELVGTSLVEKWEDQAGDAASQLKADIEDALPASEGTVIEPAAQQCADKSGD
jgi:TRAP-type C4-dicarboxylate transport system substrate-binding protein